MPGANPSGGGFSWGALAARPAANVGISLYYATDNGNLYWSDGAVWHLSGANDIPIAMASGNYYFLTAPGGTTNISVPGGTLKAAPFQVPHDLTFSRVGMEVFTAGDVGTLIALGFYNDNGAGYPGSLALAAGTVAGDSPTVQEIVINRAFAASMYWCATLVEGAPVTAPVVRGINGLASPIAVGSPTIPGAAATTVGYQLSGQGNALPDPFPVGASSANIPVRMFAKVA